MTEPAEDRADGRTADDYALGKSESETNRLVRHSGFYGPLTARAVLEMPATVSACPRRA